MHRCHNTNNNDLIMRLSSIIAVLQHLLNNSSCFYVFYTGVPAIDLQLDQETPNILTVTFKKYEFFNLTAKCSAPVTFISLTGQRTTRHFFKVPDEILTNFYQFFVKAIYLKERKYFCPEQTLTIFQIFESAQEIQYPIQYLCPAHGRPDKVNKCNNI